MPFNEIIPVYTENHNKPWKKNSGLLFIKADGTYIYNMALKGS
jgi:hypothetical protein